MEHASGVALLPPHIASASRGGKTESRPEQHAATSPEVLRTTQLPTLASMMLCEKDQALRDFLR